MAPKDVRAEREARPQQARLKRRARAKDERTKAGRRLVAALKEVLADVRGETGLPVVAEIPERLDVKAIRNKSGLSQAAFSERFGINRRTLQDWERDRYRPDPMARALLTIIDREPDAVLRALGDDGLAARAVALSETQEEYLPAARGSRARRTEV